GAAVRVSLICFGKGSEAPVQLDGCVADRINADLTGSNVDLTKAKRLPSNRGLAFQGPVKVGSFEISGGIARQWLKAPTNPNGRPNSDVVRPWVNGMDLVRRPSGQWII